MIIHLILANIMLLNYLIAILSTVYENMIDLGAYYLKSDTYKFIEKYSIPILDDAGFQELVVYPPPLNLFTILLFPFAMKPESMRKIGQGFSKLMFWFENIILLMF
jgi:hypothetical protein